MNNKLFFLPLLLVLFISPSSASDHIDGPVTTGHRVGDLSDLYAFPTPNKPGFLSVILDMYPVAEPEGHFSDRVSYTIFLRRAKIRPAGQPTGFDTSDEVSINCTFVTPGSHAEHVATCKTSTGLQASAKFNVVAEQGAGEDFRLFAGHRNDPFFFDAGFAGALAKGTMAEKKGKNIMANINCLSIIMEIETGKLFKGDAPRLIALAAQALTDNGARQLDRVGRPEITNVSMVSRGDADLRDQYNLDRPFQVSNDFQQQYQSRLARNIDLYDRVDGKQNWDSQERHRLAAILADDFLVVDVTKPCKEVGFLEIEKAMLQGKQYKTCGGRKPTDGIMEILYTLYVGSYAGERVSDGVTQPQEPVTDTFPYLAGPDFSWRAEAKLRLVLFAKGLADFFGIKLI